MNNRPTRAQLATQNITMAQALAEIILIVEGGTAGHDAKIPCKSPTLDVKQATALRAAISKTAREALATLRNPS